MSIARVAARIVLRDLASIYSSPEAIVRQLVGIKMSYRRQDMLRDANRAIGWDKHRAAMQADPLMPAGLRDTIPSWDFGEGQRYKIYGTSVWRDEVSGQLIKKQSSMFTDVLWEEDEAIEDDFGDMFGTDEERYRGRTFIGFQISGVEHNVDMPHQRLTRL